MRIYEGMFVLDDSRSNSNWDGVLREMRGLLERRGAEIFTAERWDERRLAYRINGRNRGVYLLTKFTAPPEAVQDIKRDAEMNDTVLRLLVIRDWDSEKLHKDGLFPPPEEGEEAEESQEKGEEAAKEEGSEEQAPQEQTDEAQDQAEKPKEGETEETNAQDTQGEAQAQGGEQPKPQQDSA